MENKSRGMACVFSLKNPTFPEYICLSSCAILCLDVNPYHPHMLAVGLMNGNVAVYNLQIKTKLPTYISNSINGKHRNLINQVTENTLEDCALAILWVVRYIQINDLNFLFKVKWSKDDIDGYLNFYAVSEDGTISHWTLIKTAIRYSQILSIPFTKRLKNQTSDTQSSLKGTSIKKISSILWVYMQF